MYDANYEDSLMRTVLDSSSQHSGLRVLNDNSKEAPVQNISIRAADIAAQSLPVVRDEELPLPLSDARRTYSSAIPGIKLTHPSGAFQGGIEQRNDGQETFIDDFLVNNATINTDEQLQRAVDYEVGVNTNLLKDRMHARLKAKEKNEMLEKEIKTLVMTHDTELRVQRRMLDEQQARKEAKARRRQERTID